MRLVGRAVSQVGWSGILLQRRVLYAIYRPEYNIASLGLFGVEYLEVW